MTVLVDEPLWWWRGRRWCHLVSDESLDELHRFAGGLGISRRAFQGDHYDIPEEYRDDVLAAGALPVSSRELLRRLRDAGLRLTPAQRRATPSADTAGLDAAPPQEGRTADYGAQGPGGGHDSGHLGR